MSASAHLPPTDLPVEEVVAQVCDTLARRRNAVVVAPPGAGKTTITPLRLLEQPWVDNGRIVVLEPRRVAARAAAQRMAQLLGETVGETVGYQTRDERRIGQNTRIEVVTEGILTRRLQHDPTLGDTAVVIFDEIHERNVPTDLGLAFLLDARRALGTATAILAMSATADADRFARVLGDSQGPADIIVSDGRQYPVEIEYLPSARPQQSSRRQSGSGQHSRQRSVPRLEHRVADAVMTALAENSSTEHDGDVLVFLPGIGEINRCRDELTQRLASHTASGSVTIHRLAGSLPLSEQDETLRRSFGVDGRPASRRVILSTDIAETSLTVDGVSIVIDSGLARAPRLDVRTGLTELVTVTTSRASADQRSGRAGRLGPGVAYRLWGKIDDATRLAHAPAEITQVDLSSVALEIAAWGTPVDTLTFLDPLPDKTLRLALDTLSMLHLVDEQTRPTALGQRVLALPLHPRLGTMVARNSDSPQRGWMSCVVAALLEERDIFRRAPRADNDSTPIDLALRSKIVEAITSHDGTDPGAIRRVRDSARDIARRAGISPVSLSEDDIDALCGPVLLAAYPDRLAKRRDTAGQFVMRSGGEARCDPHDPVAREMFVIAADVDPQRKHSVMRRAAAIDISDIAPVLGDDLTLLTHLTWDSSRNDLVMRVVRKTGSITIDERDVPPTAGDETRRELLDRIRQTRLAVLGNDGTALRQRIEFLRHHRGEPWPDVSTKSLIARLDELIGPYLTHATSRADLERIDVTMILESELGWDLSQELARLAPVEFTPAGRGQLAQRSVRIDYSDPDAPTIAIRVQQLFGQTTHPCVLDGAIPLRIQLLSPADRPIQVTSDLPGFWTGSWAQVRKEMAGRYPKHEWPANPNA